MNPSYLPLPKDNNRSLPQPGIGRPNQGSNLENKVGKKLPQRLKNNEDDGSQVSNITSKIDGIILNVQGMIESALFFDGDAIYCKYDIAFGPDWQIGNGKKRGQSQHATQGEGSSHFFVWNGPFELSLKSTNPSGWPQVAISCFGPDFFGREVLKAYGLVYIPTTPGTHKRTLQMFSPISSSVVVEAMGMFGGQKPEIINAPNVLSTGEGREVIRSQSEGSMTIMFNVELTNMNELGYNV